MPFVNMKPVLLNKDVSIWIADVEFYNHYLNYFYGILNKEERKLVHKITKEKRKNHTIIQRGILKTLLAGELKILPADVYVKKGEAGKPYLEESGIYFNYSHSGRYFMVGITREKEIGVDIQIPKKLKYSYPMVIFTEHEKEYYHRLLKSAEKENFFWKIWTIKEAFSKATGEGMTIDYGNIQIQKKDDSKSFISIPDKNEMYSVQLGSFDRINYYYSYVLLDKKIF